jgi:tRNA C32,U32 (ribose-2'-O)-methylase TrmJ
MTISKMIPTQAKTPLNISMAAQNALLQIREWQATHQESMPDPEQLRVFVCHLGDFIRGRAFVAEQRKETLRVFVEALCPDEQCTDILQDVLDEKKAA